MAQMSFAQIGTLYNAISNQLEGGVTPQNKQALLHQVSTVQTQIQGLINNGTFNGFTDPKTGNLSIVHAQNIADQMTFLSDQINTFGQAAATPQHGKFINDVVRDVQDIVAGDAHLTGLAHQGGASGFQQVSNLLTPPNPFPDTPVQTATLNKFVADSNNLATMATKAIADPHFDPNSAATHTLIGQIQTFTNGANAYVNAADQAGVFAARFQNEFATHGVQGTASADLIKGLQTHDTNLVNGAASVLKANANDVTGNMLQSGQAFTPVANFGIPAVVDTVHLAGQVFDDAVTKLIGGVDSVNQKGVVADLNAAQGGLQHVIAQGGIPAAELQHLTSLVSLLGTESKLAAGINTANPTQVSQVNTQLHQGVVDILNTVNNDVALHTAAAGSFIPLPPANNGSGHDLMANNAQGNHQVAAATDMSAANQAAVTHAADLTHLAVNTPAPAPQPPAPIPPTPMPVSHPTQAPAVPMNLLNPALDTGHHMVNIHVHDHLV